MDVFDIFLVPLYLLIIYAIANRFKGKYTDKTTRQYFFKALTVKLIGALGIGFIYQFYYSNGEVLGGDTGKYFDQAQVVSQALGENFGAGIKLLFSNGEYDPDTYPYSSRIFWYESQNEFTVIKIAGVFSFLTFNSYGCIALLFAATSFIGIWAMYMTFYKLYPSLHKQFAIAILFLPSVFFWGSGVMKDSLTIGALGLLFHGFYVVAIEKKRIIFILLYAMLAAYLIYLVKVYILLAFLPPALFWVFIENNQRIKNSFVRNLARPFFLLIGGGAAYFGATNLTAGDRSYDIEKIGERTKINAIYLSEYVDSGSAYNIGIFDGSLASFIEVAPQAIIIALYRPFIWEVRNPLMLLSALEAMVFIYLTISLIIKTGFFKTVKLISSVPVLLFCILFSLIFAFAVGSNSGNFGTLVRYKIPLMPFYLSALYIMRYYYVLKKPKRAPQKVMTFS